MSTFLTLEYDGEEKALGDWGLDLETAEFTILNMATDVFTVAQPAADITDDPLFDFEEPIIVRRNRTLTLGVFSGGTIEFQGTRMSHVLDGRPDYEGIVYHFGGPWWDIEKTPFQQSCKTYTGDPDALGTITHSDAILFQRYDTLTVGSVVRINTGEQITDILQRVLDDYAALSLAAPFQIGTITPAANVVTYQVKDIMCSEALRMCLRAHPDTTVYFDYTTTPPTCQVTNDADPVSLGFANGTNHKSIKISPRPDLMVRSVVLYFKQTNEVDGISWQQVTKQKYGPHGLNSGSDPDGGPRVLVQTIDLQGSSRADVFGALVCAAVDVNSSDTPASPGLASARRAWWALPSHKPELASSQLRTMTIGDATITEVLADGTLGSSISLSTYPNELLDGAIAPWMKLGDDTPVTGKRVLITAKATYDVFDADGASGSYIATNGNPIHRKLIKELSVHLTVTNGTTGDYSAIASEVAGEEIPSGLAQSIYDALNTLQYDGTDLRVEDEVSGLVGMNNVLNLTGGRAEWETMDAIIQQVHRRYGRGYSEVTIGPASHLSAGDLTQLFLFNRFRRIFYDPTTQATARSSASASQVTLAQNAPKNNTTHGLETPALSGVSAAADGSNACQVLKDATNKKVLLQIVDNSNPPVQVTGKAVEISILGSGSGTDKGCLGSDTNYHKVYLQETEFCVSGVLKRCIILRSDPFDPP